MSLVDVIARFSTAAADGSPGGYVVTRTPIGAYPNGRYVAGTPTTFTVNMSVQPYGGGLEVLPEGLHQEDLRVMYSPVELLMSPTPDSVVIAGEAFTVFNVDGPFTLSGVKHWRVYAARQPIP